MTNQRLELTWFNKDQALIPTETGDYDYLWVSPSDPRYCETHTLEITDHVVGTQAPKEDGVTYSERADLPPTDDNLLILGESGDVLEALTRVPELADKYAGQVKCIYIDPPFNTAQTFTDYADNLQHSVWLTMMRDRLQHMHTLLADEGSIWVHLDDVENHRMRVLLDEVFGPENFIAEVSWEKVAGRDNRSKMSKTCDFITVYAKKVASFKESRNLLPRGIGSGGADYGNPDNDPRGPWTSADFTAQFNPAENPREAQRYTLVTPAGNSYEPPAGRCWLYTRPRYEELVADNRVWFGDDGQNIPRLKRFLSEVQDGLVPKTLWTQKEVGTNDSAKKEIQNIFPRLSPFTTPKPERLLERVIHIATNPGDIVLDVFAGSGTTAAVAQKMGRRWVTCELQENNFTTFTRPRLEKVVHGEDQGGITTVENLVPRSPIEVPDNNTAKDMKDAALLLGRIAKQDNLDAESQKLLKECKKLINPRSEKKVNWRGGGRFAVARLSPACFDFDETLGLTLLTDAATGETLINSVAANLNFYRTPEHPVFHGVRGRMRLVVVEGTLLTTRVDELLAELDEGELLTIATTEPDEAIRSHLRQVRRGCRLIHIPDDIFHPTTAQEA